MFKRKITTISFEGNEIRYLILRGKQVKAWQSYQLPSEHMSQGLVHSPKIVGEVIKKNLKDLKGSRRQVVSAVSGIRSVHRILTVPNIPDKLLRETIQRKARQEFAIPVEDTDLSWQVISRKEGQILLYVLAVPKNLIDQAVATLREAKIKPRLLDIKPLALTRVVNQGTAIIINLEDHSMGVVIQVNYVPLLIRTIPLESGDLTGEAKTDLLAQELARTVKYYNGSHKQNPLPEDTPVVLTGALFTTNGIESRLEDTPSLIERMQKRTPYPIKPPTTDLELPEKFPLLRYAVNVGLASKNSK